ncbi:histidinol-phosphate transaminase [Methylophaga thiooxydans]|uniref:Histidinol-phosphate aminotransferase n=1 Tax=Methylophaga thiooxydans DMS010 TaxID=637616 RepID=C0N1H6_9GAMM|nr:histidinol-phosphate transaminase [Methylophaga thiooxydans]EEF81378.1 histidinol-phosphate aminotransferase [Methylophaga thiooxydans DMS010]
MSRYWSAFVHNLEPYVPGEQPKIANLIKLNTNENPYGPSPKVLEAIHFDVSDKLRLYPDPTSRELKEAIADFYKVNTANVFVGNGSDEVLGHIFHALFQHEPPLLFPDITYSFYPVYCQLYKIDYQTIPLTNDFQIDIADYLRDNGGIIFPNPNAPTGCLLALADIERLLKANTESVVVIDEAYIDFGGETAISLVDSYPNLIVTQTFSKSRSLAGMRIGFAVGHPDLIEALVRVKDSFNSYPLDSLATSAGVAAIKDDAYFRDTCNKVISSRDKLTASLNELGFEVLPSAANFIFTRHPAFDAADLAMKLRKEGIIVRHFNKRRIDQFLRITIGTPSENQHLLSVLDGLV